MEHWGFRNNPEKLPGVDSVTEPGWWIGRQRLMALNGAENSHCMKAEFRAHVSNCIIHLPFTTDVNTSLAPGPHLQ